MSHKYEDLVEEIERCKKYYHKEHGVNATDIILGKKYIIIYRKKEKS